MFTSRAENRLYMRYNWRNTFFSTIFTFLRPDNADLRLTEEGRKVGLVGDVRWNHFQQMRSRLDLLRERLVIKCLFFLFANN